jgi:hypothetical protein
MIKIQKKSNTIELEAFHQDLTMKLEKSDYNLNSTNQTSVEVSIEDSNPHQTDYKLSGVLKVPEESFLNF